MVERSTKRVENSVRKGEIARYNNISFPHCVFIRIVLQTHENTGLLQKELKQASFISVLLKRDQQSNQSRGFGFITFENPADADEAVKQLDKTVSVESFMTIRQGFMVSCTVKFCVFNDGKSFTKCQNSSLIQIDSICRC